MNEYEVWLPVSIEPLSVVVRAGEADMMDALGRLLFVNGSQIVAAFAPDHWVRFKLIREDVKP